MKIIHTADWHIGKVLYKQSLLEEIEMFFDWLLHCIQVENADVLIVSGDIFDLANPSHKDTTVYYRFLFRLSALNIQTIITGGNHDSISLLNAPHPILQKLNIHVVGGVPENKAEQIIPIYNADGHPECIVLAVPYLRDKDLRVSKPADESSSKVDTTPQAIKSIYDDLVSICHHLYGQEVPIVAMGHLFMKGSITSDSEREIHVGHLQGIDTTYIHPDISYLALGHIHQPQRIGKKDHLRYSGSPIFLDFSEAKVEKMVICIEIHQLKVKAINPIHVPVFRTLKSFTGDIASIQTQLEAYECTAPLKSFIEIVVLEAHYDLDKILALERMTTMENNEYTIIKSRIQFADNATPSLDHSLTSVNLHELSPFDILKQRLASEELPIDLVQKVEIAYGEMLELIQS